MSKLREKLQAARHVWREMESRFDPELPYHRVVVRRAIVCAGNGDQRGFDALMLWFFPDQVREFRELCAQHGLLDRRANPDGQRRRNGNWRQDLDRALVSFTQT